MKAKTIGKRVFSLVLTTIMLISCWVFVAPQADAATAGTYTVKVRMYCVGGDSADCDDNDGVRIYMDTTNKNGDGSSSKNDLQFPGGGKSSTWKDVVQGGADKTEQLTTSAGYFPTNIDLKIDFDSGGWRSAKLHLKVFIGNTEIYDSGDFDIGGGELWSHQVVWKSFGIDSSKYPKATSADSFSVSNVTIPTSGSTTTTASIGTVRDQYGVSWYQDGNGLDFTTPTGVSASGKVITVSSSAMLSSSPFYKDTEVKPKCGSVVLSNSVTWRITNPTYTVTWHWHKNGDASSTWSGSTTSTGIYYNQTPSVP